MNEQLKIILDIDGVQKAQADLDKIDKKVGVFDVTLQKASRGIGKLSGLLAGGFSVAAFVAATKHSLDFADSIADASENTAFSVRKLQELRFAADQSGIAINTLDGALARFTKRLGLARAGTGAAAETYRQLGIDLKQTNEQVFEQVVATLGAMEDDTNRAALATRLFGDDAQRMGVLLRDGNEGLKAYADQAERLGLILSDELVAGASDANDKLAVMKQVVNAQFVKVFAELAPTITRVGQSFADAAPQVAAFFDSFNPIDQQSMGALQKTYAALESQLERERIKLNDRLAINSKKAAGKVWNPIADVILPSEDDLRARIDGIKDQMQAAADYIEIEQAKINDKLFEAKYPKAAPELTEQQKQYNAMLREAQSLTRSLRTPAEEYEDALFRINDLYQESVISYDTYQRAVLKAQDDMAKALDKQKEKLKDDAVTVSGFARDMGLTFSSAFEDAIVQGERLSGVLQGVAEDLIRIVMRRSVTEPLGTAVSGFIGSSGIGDFFGSLFHTGGTDGEGVPRRVDPAVFANAPRFHTGIGPDEQAAIIQRSEGVFTAGQMRALAPIEDVRRVAGGGTTVNIIEAPGRGGEMNERQDGGQNILDVYVERIKASIADDIASGRGQVPSAMQGTYGLNRAAGGY